jgi:hypothetical protein
MAMLLEATDATADSVALVPEATTVSRQSRNAIMRVPLIMPDGQEFYWQFPWQRDERETLADGESVVFASEDPEDAARWLREADDEDE